MSKVDDLLKQLAQASTHLLRATELANELQRENADRERQMKLLERVWIHSREVDEHLSKTSLYGAKLH